MSNGAIVGFASNFDSLDASDSAASLGGEGWQWFANVFDPTGANYLGGYFGGTNFGGASAAGLSGTPGDQQMVVYSDYGNDGDQGAGNIIEMNVYQQQAITIDDVGSTWYFSFDAAPAATNALLPPSTAIAFIKVFPNDFSTLLAFPTADTSTLAGPISEELEVTIDAGMVGGFVQFGFSNQATNYNNSAVDYDNVSFSQTSIPEPSTAILGLIGLGFLTVRRRS
ncbi:PEP-CTERM sorting domain-containing protein [Roseibacillus persicicus]|uniref:PEP-CTERM sorting domain-containing protein n=1 Tax=Roseibacillus persicicus TaxID=454148 RepID=UPI00280C8547|nr:PEP-CTERM sorting domain-containing protein [Roseibacillus persicicus]MDQ8191366.1 PEP-CTERM sorting domain-containing protein [Roseibacillus persicicus]